jgi:hypothetical protein
MCKQTRISYHRELIKDYLNECQYSVIDTMRRLNDSLRSFEILMGFVR